MYAKVFQQIYDGTLCTHGPWQALVTFQQLLVLADPDGHVDMTAAAISRRTTIPIEIINIGIQKLLDPDPESRTPTEDGRRILPLAEGRLWGWRIVNYTHYRGLKREEDRREYHREYWHKRKSNKTQQTQQTQQTQPNQPKKETVERRKEKEERESVEKPRSAAASPTSRGSRLPEGWTPEPAHLAFAEGLGLRNGRVASELEKFRDYWAAQPGQKGVKTDWPATWRNWVRRVVETGPGRAAIAPGMDLDGVH